MKEETKPTEGLQTDEQWESEQIVNPCPVCNYYACAEHATPEPLSEQTSSVIRDFRSTEKNDFTPNEKQSAENAQSISEQKQEGETENQKLSPPEIAAYENSQKYPDRNEAEYAFMDGVEWQSQHTANQIDQYKARIDTLEALLKNSRNAIAELNESELQFGIQLCNDIDAALEAEILTLKNR